MGGGGDYPFYSSMCESELCGLSAEKQEGMLLIGTYFLHLLELNEFIVVVNYYSSLKVDYLSLLQLMI